MVDGTITHVPKIPVNMNREKKREILIFISFSNKFELISFDIIIDGKQLNKLLKKMLFLLLFFNISRKVIYAQIPFLLLS